MFHGFHLKPIKEVLWIAIRKNCLTNIFVKLFPHLSGDNEFKFITSTSLRGQWVFITYLLLRVYRNDSLSSIGQTFAVTNKGNVYEVFMWSAWFNEIIPLLWYILENGILMSIGTQITLSHAKLPAVMLFAIPATDMTFKLITAWHVQELIIDL